MTSSYPPSTVANHLLTKLLNSLLPVPVSSTSSTFTLSPPTVSTATTPASTSTLPPISSLMSTAVQTSLPPFSCLLPLFPLLLLQLQLFLFCHKMLSPRLHIYNNMLPSVSSQKYCNKESPSIQNDLNWPQVMLVHTSEESSTLPYKQKLNQYNNTLNLYSYCFGCPFFLFVELLILQ